MKCRQCGGTMQSIIADLPFKTRNSAVVIIRDLPVLQCGSCREYELEDETMKYVDKKLSSLSNSTELEIFRYAV